MRKITIRMIVGTLLGGLVCAAVLWGLAAAPGFVAGSASTIRLPAATEVSR